jgi:hypothetical protein
MSEQDDRPVLPDRSEDDDDIGWGDRVEDEDRDEARYLAERPPHHDSA